ncbi:hypothetical protein SDJN03_25589, partial [Cucurbita argyrosperma subsp. sororia]
MSSIGTSKGILEIAKFGIYVTIPIFLMYTFANNSKNLQKFIGKSYIVTTFADDMWSNYESAFEVERARKAINNPEKGLVTQVESAETCTLTIFKS